MHIAKHGDVEIQIDRENVSKTLSWSRMSVCILNTGSSTYFHPGTCMSAIDLSLCDPSLYLDFTWSVHTDLSRSDHYPLLVMLRLSNRKFVIAIILNNRIKSKWRCWVTWLFHLAWPSSAAIVGVGRVFLYSRPSVEWMREREGGINRRPPAFNCYRVELATGTGVVTRQRQLMHAMKPSL